MEFDIIETGFNSADETINFGRRSLGDATNLYETSTIACFKSSEELKIEKVHVNSLVRSDEVFLSINSTLRVFKNKECAEIVYSALLECSIDTLCVSPDLKYLLTCLANGTIIVFNYLSDGKECLFTECLEKDVSSRDKCFVNSFVEISEEKKLSFILVSNKGKIFRIILENEDEVKVSIELIHDFQYSIEHSAFSYPFLFCNGTKLFVLDIENQERQSSIALDFKRVFFFGRTIIALKEDGKILRICPSTLIAFEMEFEEQFSDITVNSNVHEYNLLALTKPNAVGESFLQLLCGPQFIKKFNLKISSNVNIFQEDSISDDILFVSKISDNDCISELRICTVNETEPEKRLIRLVERKKFEEAEMFAKTYNINPEIIPKAKVQAIVDSSISKENIIDLFDLLNQIQDVEFKLMTCTNADDFCNNVDDFRKILKYGVALKIPNDCNKGRLLVVKQNLMDIFFKLDTFKAIDKSGTLQEWFNFADADLIEELKTYLRNHDIEAAGILYSRLDNRSLGKLGDEEITDILRILDNLTLEVYQPFLPTFISVTLEHCPSSLPILICWTINRVKSLEKRNSGKFPENALKFIENIQHLVQAQNEDNELFQNHSSLNNNSLKLLYEIVEALNIIQVLKNNYGIIILLSDCLCGPKAIVGCLLNVTLCPEEYERFLQTFLCEFMLKHHLDHNEILLNEIQKLLRFEESYWIHSVSSIVRCISSITTEIEAVKLILQTASVPWCDEIKALGKNVLHYSNPMVDKIRELIENEPVFIVLSRPSYQFTEKKVTRSNINLERVINRMIYVNEPTLVEDVYKLAKSDSDRNLINMLVIDALIKQKRNEEALEVLDNNNPKEIALCSNNLLKKLELCINEDLSCVDNYYNLRNSFNNRFQNNKIHSNFVTQWNKYDFRIIRAAYYLRKEYGLKVVTLDLLNKQKAEKMYDEVLEKVIESFLESLDVFEAIKTCEKIASWLNLNKNDVIVKFLKSINIVDAVSQAATYLLDRDNNSRNLCLVALLLLKQYDYSNNESLNETRVDYNAMESLNLAKNLTVKAITNAGYDNFEACLPVIDWIKNCFYSTESNSVTSRLVFDSVLRIFNAYCRSVAKFRNENTRYLTYFIRDNQILSQDDFVKQMKFLPNTIDILYKSGQHKTAFNLINILQSNLKNIFEIDSKNYEIINSLLVCKCIPVLLNVTASKPMLDKTLFYHLLLSCDQNEVIKYIEKFIRLHKRQPQKLNDLSEVALKVIVHLKLLLSPEPFVNSILTVKWWQKVNNRKLQYDTFFKSNAETRLDMLMKLNCLDAVQIKQYCDDFKLDLQTAYKLCLERILIDFKPDYEVVTDIADNRKIIITNDEETLMKRCAPFIEAIQPKERILQILNKVWQKVNFYYYEVFICIIKIRTSITKVDSNNGLLVLLFFKNYQRIRRPSEIEAEQWFSEYPEKHSLDPLSEFRLPFTSSLFSKEVWSIIRPEINLDTYKIWLGAIPIFKDHLRSDEICCLAIKDVVTNGILGKNQTSEWILYPKFEDLFAKIDECASYICNLKVCISAIHYVMSQTPKGIDKVNAAALCYKYTCNYKEQNCNDHEANEAFLKIKKKLHSYSVMNILHSFKLNKEKYVDLVLMPEELVTTLYFDDRIVKCTDLLDLSCPDINKAVDAIAAFCNLDILQIRLDLLMSWLSNSCDADSAAMFMVKWTQNNTNNKNQHLYTDDNLKRAVYICGSGDILFWQTHLVKLFLDDDDNNAAICKARALKCVCLISDKNVLEQMVGLKFAEILDYGDKLSLLSQMEDRGFDMNIESLNQCNKKDLLRRFSKERDKSSIVLMATICMTFKIFDLEYWEFIINIAAKDGMFNELQIFMKFLRKYQYADIIVNTWQTIIDNVFHFNCSAKETEKEISLVVNDFLMIQKCPVLYSLNFEGTIKRCMHYGQFSSAAILLQYLVSSNQELYAKEILKSCKTIYADLDALYARGVWGVPYVKNYLRSIE